jgi:hypothetical protein
MAFFCFFRQIKVSFGGLALAHDMSTHPQQAQAHAIRFLSIDAIVRAQEGQR